MMSEKRILRDRAVLVKKSTDLSSTKYVSSKRKSNEKENCLLQANLKEDNDNICNKIADELQKNKNQNRDGSKRKITRKNSTTKIKVCPIKERNLFNKLIDSPECIKKNDSVKQNVSDKISFKSKDSTKNIEYPKTTFLNNVENIHPEKVLNTKTKDTVFASSKKKIPIWKRNIPVSKINEELCKDVYDIAFDEDIVSNEVQNKKGRIQSIKNRKEKKINRSYSSKNLKSKKKKMCNSKPIDRRPAFNANQILTIKPIPIEIDKLVVTQTSPSDQNVYGNEICVEQNYQENTFSLSSVDEVIESIPSKLDTQSSGPLNQSKTYLSTLADELERSFSVPKMTSTPDGIHVKTGIHAQKNKVISVTDISAIPPSNRNCVNSTIATPSFPNTDVLPETDKDISVTDISTIPPSNRNCLNSTVATSDFPITDVLPKTDKDFQEITLFESPEKEEKNDKVSSPKKSIQFNLFGDVLHTPSSVDSSSEESVLMPKKGYHTPDFKVHLIRTKRAVPKTKKELQKSKQDLLIEKMSQHFDEIENTVLCIE